MQPSPAEAAQTLLRRRQARKSLLAFTKYTFPRYQADAFHATVAQALEAVVEGEITRLMICAPPQHGKSELASRRFPAYWLGRRPNDPVILCSYAASLAYSMSRHARTIVESAEYGKLFPEVTTRRDSRAVDHWELAAPHRGSMLAAGVGGPITGHGAPLAIIDDPFENWAEAQSETVRKAKWDWYRTTFRTRVWEGGAIVVVMTRWHEEDTAGMLLASQGDEWVVLRCPALAETQAERDQNNEHLGLPLGERDPLGRRPGEALAPSRYSRRALLALQRDVGSLAWAGEYQGVPRPAEGSMFHRDWFKLAEAAPERASRVRYWDKAATEGGGAHSAGVLMAAAGGEYWIEDVVRGQWSAGQRDAVMKQTAELDAARYGGTVKTWTEQEPGSGGKESAQATVKLLAGHDVHYEPVTGSKEVRAAPFAAQCEAGNVHLVTGPWVHDFIEEAVTFPNGKFKDQIDAGAGAFNKLAGAKSSLAIRPKAAHLYKGRGQVGGGRGVHGRRR